MKFSSLILGVFCLLILSQQSEVSAQKVFAHFMLLMTYGHDSVDLYTEDIRSARRGGIEGFALNLDQWDDLFQTRVRNMFQAAQNLNDGFKLFFSLDMTKGEALGPSQVQDMISRYANHPNMYKRDGKVFVSSFLGMEKFGTRPGYDGWNDQVLKPLRDRGIQTFFVPQFRGYSNYEDLKNNLFKAIPSLDGLFNWWPYNADTLQNEATDTNDREYRRATSDLGKLFMASTTPWFAAHHGHMNMVMMNYRGAHSWVQQWNNMLHVKPDLIEIVTWNDMAESTYLTPRVLASAVGAGEFAGTSYSHVAYNELAKPWIRAFQQGASSPIFINGQDEVYLFYRTEMLTARATSDAFGPAKNKDKLQDHLYLVVIAAAPGEVILTTGTHHSSQTFQVKTGLNMFEMPIQSGPQSAKLNRGGRTIIHLSPGQHVNADVTSYNYNVFSDFKIAHSADSGSVNNAPPPVHQPGAPAGQTQSSVHAGEYNLVNANSGKCLDVWHGRREPGHTVYQWGCHDGASMVWTVGSNGQIINFNSKSCLDVKGGVQDNGVNFIQWYCNNQDNQKFMFEAHHDGSYYIINRNSGKVLDTERASREDGAHVLQWNKSNVSHQRWFLRRVSTATSKP